jgi:hypothetical protein
MTVIADNKKRVTLPTKPGERFDLQRIGQDIFILTRFLFDRPTNGLAFVINLEIGGCSS